jgi:hypothetical protein
MSDFREITLSDREALTDIFQRLQPVSSEYSFPYLYIWRRDYNLRIGMFNNYLCIVTNPSSAFPFAFCPIPADGRQDPGDFKKAMGAIESHFREQGHELAFARIREEDVPAIVSYLGGRAQVEYRPDASDYVYEASDLAGLAGRKYSGKRNHISQFRRMYADVEYVPVDAWNIGECMKVFEAWCLKNESACEGGDSCEKWACGELLNNWDLFGMKGALVRVNGRFEAFTIGEAISRDVAAIRFEKGNSDIHGIYTYINREFCARELSGFRYVNREEDMGIEGLRKSKESYYPAFMVKKYVVRK